MADNKEMKTLGGYEIVDEKARQDINIVAEKADEAYSLAKGATKAFVYDTYSDMIVELNALDKAELLVNFHVMIREVCVPDLWISGVSDEHVEYTYTSNEDFITDLTEDGVVQVGYFVLSALETQKVELDDYVKKTDYATANVGGVVKVNSYSHGIVISDGKISIYRADKKTVDDKTDGYRAITPSVLDYAVKKALSDCKLEGDDAWTEEEKAKALETLGGLKKPTTGDGVLYFDSGLNMTVVKITDGTVASAYQIPIYAQGGVLPVGTPTTDAHATTKKYVDDGFVGKVTTETDIQQAYVKGADGSQKMVNVTNISQANTIVERDGSGNFYVSAPTLSSHVTTKKYVDDLVTSTKDSIALRDVSTGQIYNIRVNNGTLEMV